jgi:trimeric autotransporter adhesin
MRRQFLLICLVSGLHLTGVPIVGNAAGPTDSTPAGITIGEAVVNAQGRVSIDVTLASGDQPVTAVQFDLQYQNQTMGLSVSAGSAINSAGKTIATSNPQPAVARILIAGLNRTPIPNGVIATLSLQVKAGTPPGFYPLEAANGVGSDSNGGPVYLPANGVGGVTVPGPASLAAANSASYARGAVAPGEIVVLGGRSLGPATTTTLQFTATGLVATSLGGTRVLFDGIAAPLVYTAQNQVSAVVPYAVDGHSQTSLQVEYQGVLSAPLVLDVARVAPGIFTLNKSGSGQGAIVNQDGTVNGPDNPAPRGSVVSVYGTGEGQTVPPGIDGSLVAPSDLRRPVLPVTASIGGQNADVVYAGSVGNQISGLFQANVRVPLSIAPGGSVPVMLTIAGSSSQTVTMVVQ